MLAWVIALPPSFGDSRGGSCVAPVTRWGLAGDAFVPHLRMIYGVGVPQAAVGVRWGHIHRAQTMARVLIVLYVVLGWARAAACGRCEKNVK